MYRCPHCQQRFYSVVDCAAHQETEHSDEGNAECEVVAFRCPKCGDTFMHPMDCRNHVWRNHGLYTGKCSEFVMDAVEEAG